MSDSRWRDNWEAACITVSDAVGPEEAIRLLCEGRQQPLSNRTEAIDWLWADETETRSWLMSGEVDGRTFVWEHNHFRGVHSTNARELSRDGRSSSMFWNVNAVTDFTLVVNGDVLAQFEYPTTSDLATLAAHGATRGSMRSWDLDKVESGLRAQSEIFGLNSSASPAWLDSPSVRHWGVVHNWGRET